MITVRLYTGQILRFPDGTPEEVIRRAAQSVTASAPATTRAKPTGEGETVDLSHLREPDAAPVTRPATYDLSRLREPETEPHPLARAGALPAVGRVEGGTPERPVWRRAIDASAAAGSTPFRVLSGALDVAETIPEALGVAGTTALEGNLQLANTPRLPLQAAEALIRRGVRPLEEAAGYPLVSPRSVVPDPIGDVVSRASELREQATRNLAEGSQHLPTPVAAGIFGGATAAGIAADAGNLIGGERAFGAGGRALTELEQAAAARSGRYLPGAQEPLLRLERNWAQGSNRASSENFIGTIPDKLRDITGRPWRTYAGNEPYRRPTSPEPRPRWVDREPLPVTIVGGTAEDQERILGLWGYASRRYPQVAKTVPSITIRDKGGGAGVNIATGEMSLPADADLGMLMHELTHSAQRLRKGTLSEAYPMRMEEVYGRIPQPQPRKSGPYDRLFTDEQLDEAAVRGNIDWDELEDAMDGDLLEIPPRPTDAVAGRGLSDDDLYEAIRTTPADDPRRGVLQAELDRRDAEFAARRERALREIPPTDPADVEFSLPWWKRIGSGSSGDAVLPRTAAEERAREVALGLRATPEQGGELAQRSLPIGEDVLPTIDPELPYGALGSQVGDADTGLSALAKVANDHRYSLDDIEDLVGPEQMSRLRVAAQGARRTEQRLATTPITELTEDEFREFLRRRAGEVVPEPQPAGPANYGALVPDEAEMAARLESAEREAFTRPPLPFRPSESGAVGPGGAAPLPAAPTPTPTPTPTVTAPNVPLHLRPLLPEEQVAEAMGWKTPTRPPSAVGPSTVLPEFQTNIPAQLGGDPQVTNYVIQRSDEVFKAIGPPQSFDTLEAMATRLGMTREDFLSRPSHWSVMSPEARLRMLHIANGDIELKIKPLQSKLVAGAATDADKAELIRLIDNQEDFIKLGASSGSAYGRALNSLKIEARLALSDDQLLRQKLYKQYSQRLDKEKPLMSMLASLDPNNTEELQAFLRYFNRPRWYEYGHEYWISSILSSPASQERNLIGNTVNAVMENIIVRPTAAGFDAARVAGTGAEREIFLRETPAAVVGLTVGIREGVHRGLEVLRRGYDPVAMQGKLFPVRSAFARSQNRVVRDIVGPAVTLPLRLLSASDALFKTMNFTAELYAQAARIASKEGLTGSNFTARVAHLRANPTDEMIEAADNFALKSTFNDDTSAVGQAIINLRDLPAASSTNPGIQLGLDSYRTTMGFIVPFVRIADRLMVRGFEYTPLGAIPAIGARRTGNFAQSADYAARAAIGSVVMTYAATLAMEGRLTAGAPSDPAERAAFFDAHKQPWAVRIGGVWIPYGGLQPIGTPLAIVAAAYDGWKNNAESPDLEKLGHAAAEVGAYVTDQSYMEGLSNFMDAVRGGDERGRAASTLLSNTAWGFTPYSGMVRSIARAVDPRLIDASTFRERIGQNVPVASLGMDARVTPWGEDVVPVGGRLRSILAPGSIMLPSREKHGTPVAQIWNLSQPPIPGIGTLDTDFDTPLSPQEEQTFEQWKQQVAPDDSGDDYDFRGAFRAGLQPDENGHWPDTYKKPWHPTFSDQSVYAPYAPGLAGRWVNGQYAPRGDFDLDGELQRLGMPLGHVGKTIADKLGRDKSLGMWKLSQPEWRMYQQFAGKASKVALERLVSSPGYQEWDVERQREEADKLIGAAREYARQLMVRYRRGMGIPGMNPTAGDVSGY